MSKDHALGYLEHELGHLDARGLLRRPAAPLAPDALTFCSNDYLGLASVGAPDGVPAGAGASRLIAGERVEHRALETAFADWLGLDDALSFTSGYAANVGVLAALAGSADLIVSDELNHASIIDGARLSRARIEVTPHNDTEAVAKALSMPRSGRAWVVVESYFSMDADGPDLAKLRAACDRHGAALIVDEAHALGVLGPAGRGRCAEAGVVPDVLVGTLGKSFGGQGALVAGRAVLRRWLWNRARSFVFSTGLAPASAAAATRSIAHVATHPELGLRVLELAERLRGALRRGGLATAPSASHPSVAGPTLVGFGHVVPILVGDPEVAMRVAATARDAGLHVQAVRPPTVPAGTARLRLALSARHTEADVDAAARVILDVLRPASASTAER